jgi:hypothetical protein
LGLMYYKGYGVNRNINKAIELFSRSVENGSSKATDELSEIYEFGIGVKKDLKKALYWIKKAEKIEEEDKESLAGIGYLNIAAIKKFKTKRLKQQINNKLPEKIANGRFYALMIGVNDYDYLPKLKTPLNDIKVLGNILKENYDFEIIKLVNPTRKQITSKLSKVEKKLLKNDSLVIYYAGHGIEKDGYGYWLPKNAETTDDSDWLSNDYVTKKIKSIKANNILVIADSCYSGTLTRGIASSDELKTLPINSYLETKSRMVMSSGGVKPVIDGGGGGHSIFARMLINKLRNNTKPIISAELYSSITKKVTEASIKYNYKQIPNLASLPQSGHEAPDFVFIPK